MKRLSKVSIQWSPAFFYAIGLITTDGSLSKDGRHIVFTSKDKDLVFLFRRCLGIHNKIGRKCRGTEREKKYYNVQFGDKNFYDFLVSIGLMSAKSKKLNSLKIPFQYFSDFFRGCLDGDGNIHIYNHPESCHPQLQIRFFSASYQFLLWIKKQLLRVIEAERGSIKPGKRVFILRYGKADSIRLLKFLYYKNDIPRLERKYFLARPFLDTLLGPGGGIGYTRTA